MSAGLVLATIFFAFISGVGGFVGTLLLYTLLENMNRVWLQRIGTAMPTKILKRGIWLASGPLMLCVFAAIRIFLAVNGMDVGELWKLAMFGATGIYCTLMSAFVFSVFDELNRLYQHKPEPE